MTFKDTQRSPAQRNLFVEKNEIYKSTHEHKDRTKRICDTT